MAEPGNVVIADRFAQGLAWQAWLESCKVNRDQFEKNYADLALKPEDQAFFAGLVDRFGGAVRVLIIGEDWCPDVFRNAPTMVRLAEAAGADVRFIHRDEQLDLMEQFKNGEYLSIPVIVFFDKDWKEIARWTERPPAQTRFQNELGDALAKEGLSEDEIRQQRRIRSDQVFRERFRQESIDEIRSLLSDPSKRGLRGGNLASLTHAGS